MDIKKDKNSQSKAEKTESELNGFYTELQNHFGQNIFELSEEALAILVKDKRSPEMDLLSMRLTIESKIRIIEKQYEKDPDDETLEKQISDLMKQDKTLEYLSKITNA